jgi:hypothetical protein
MARTRRIHKITRRISMKPAIIVTATACLFASALTTFADQFAVQLDGPVVHASQGLLDTLHVQEIDAFELEGSRYIVLSAPNADYVEAYAYALSITPVAVFALEADWTGSGLSSLPISARTPFMLATSCGFCSS